MPKILHTADWQIGRLYGSFDPDDAIPLAEARFAAVERLAALATREQVDAVVVAGDVFDAQTVSARNICRLFNALEVDLIVMVQSSSRFRLHKYFAHHADGRDGTQPAGAGSAPSGASIRYSCRVFARLSKRNGCSVSCP